MKRLFALLITIALAACARQPAEPPQSESAETAAESPDTTTSSSAIVATMETTTTTAKTVTESKTAAPLITMNTIEIIVRGEAVNFTASNANTPELEELVIRAVTILAELDENYYEAVKEIRFGPSEYADYDEGIWSTVHGGYVPKETFVTVFQSGWTFKYIVSTNIVLGIRDDGTLPIIIYTWWEELDRKLEICVEFVQEDANG